MKTSERIRKVKEYYCKTNEEFAEKIGEKPNTTSGWMSGKRGVGLSVLNKIITTYPNVSMDWLSKGDGEMLKKPDNIMSETTAIYWKESNETHLDVNTLVNALNNISEAVKLSAVADERNSRNMERMLQMIEEKEHKKGGKIQSKKAAG